MQSLHLSQVAAFSDDEERKLQKAMRTDEAGVQAILQACTHVLQQFAYHNVASEEQATAPLAQLGVSEEKQRLFVEVWGQYGKQCLQHLRQHQLGGPTLLQGVSCQPQLHMADSDIAVQHAPNALLHLQLGSHDQPGDPARVTLQLSFDETYALFQKLDTLQAQVDRMLAQ
eukprot:EG_transcript_30564